MSEYSGPTHGPAFQRSVLRLMMLDEAFCSKACGYLQEGYFSGELKWFFRKAKDYYEDFKGTPTAEYLQQEVLKHREPQKYEDERVKVMESNPDRDYVKRELTGFIRANIFVGSYREAAVLYNSGSKEDAFKFTQRKLEELQKVDFEKERVSRFGDWQVLVDRASAMKDNAIPTGIEAIDVAMNGGMMPQTWTTFIGASNSGKSMLCANLAFFAAAKGKRTFVTVHEDEEEPTKLRYLARFSGIAYNRLLTPRSMMEPWEIKKIEEADQMLSKNVVLRFMYGAECFVENVCDAARMLKKEWDFDLFLCDYGQCLKSRNTGGLKFDKKHDQQEYIYGELKQLCLELNVAGAGGAQANRDGVRMAKTGADFLRMTDVGDSFGICKKSSNVITINRSDSLVAVNRVVYLLDKVRAGRCPIAVECVTDYGRSMTHSGEVGSQREMPVAGGPVQAASDE